MSISYPSSRRQPSAALLNHLSVMQLSLTKKSDYFQRFTALANRRGRMHHLKCIHILCKRKRNIRLQLDTSKIWTFVFLSDYSTFVYLAAVLWLLVTVESQPLLTLNAINLSSVQTRNPPCPPHTRAHTHASFLAEIYLIFFYGFLVSLCLLNHLTTRSHKHVVS